MLSYVELLESFMKYTPSDHVDRKNLAQAIAKFKDLDSLFRQVKVELNIRNILNYVFKYIFFPFVSFYCTLVNSSHPTLRKLIS